MPEFTPVKIQIITPNWLGEMVLSSGFVLAGLETFPESQVDLIVKSGFEKILLPQHGQIIPFNPKKKLQKFLDKLCVLRIAIIFMLSPQIFQLHGSNIREKYRTGSAIPVNSEIFC
jgi:ADP-heptose:LPS heptosyltransferase|tara:strand:+ start:1324 stop:1671 length:348 start_codon:yes stop_codon:yes gene_type:complete